MGKNLFWLRRLRLPTCHEEGSCYQPMSRGRTAGLLLRLPTGCLLVVHCRDSIGEYRSANLKPCWHLILLPLCISG